MDDKRFDNLSKVLGTATTRQGMFRLLAGVGASAIAAVSGIDLATAKKGKGQGARAQGQGKGGKRRNGRGRGKKGKGQGNGADPALLSQPDGECPSKNQRVICHCDPPDKPNKCDAKCRAGDQGHDGHPFDCACTGPFGNLPACAAGACPGENKGACCPNCPGDKPDCCLDKDGFCTNFQNDPKNCGSCGNECKNDQTCTGGQCSGGQTCTGDCTENKNCPNLDKCVCRFGAQEVHGSTVTGACGECVANGGSAQQASECCGSDFCESTHKCETCPVTCDGSCANQEACSSKGNDCVCLGLDGVQTASRAGKSRKKGHKRGHTRTQTNPTGQCGHCIADGNPAGSKDECCSHERCPETGKCGACPVCQGECSQSNPCPKLKDCVCLHGNAQSVNSTGQCGTCLADGQQANNAGECCSGKFCEKTKTCGNCPPETCAGTCSPQHPCPSLSDELCICVEAPPVCQGTLHNGSPCTLSSDCQSCCCVDSGKSQVCASPSPSHPVCQGAAARDGGNSGTCETCPKAQVCGSGDSRVCCDPDQVCKEGTCHDQTCSGQTCDAPEICKKFSQTCVCLGLGDGRTGSCGECVADGKQANNAGECCSGKFCEQTRTCGECVTCAAQPCENREFCQTISKDCVCVFPTNGQSGKTQPTHGSCQTCLEDGAKTDNPSQCCSGAYCEATGVCGDCPTCAGACSHSNPCPKVDGADCVCDFGHASNARGKNRTGTCREVKTCAGDCTPGAQEDDCQKISSHCVCRPSGTPGRGMCTSSGGCTSNPSTCSGRCGSAVDNCGRPCTCPTGQTCNTATNTCSCVFDPQSCQAGENDLCGPDHRDNCGNPCVCPALTTCNAQGVCDPFTCVPETIEEACAGAGRHCGLVSDGCTGEYNCGVCSQHHTCQAGVCLAAGGKRKRCRGHGLAGQSCKGKKCKCTGGRNCNNGRCCETIGDGSRHCNANSDCCPGLTCARREPGQHKVCLRKGRSFSTSQATPGVALGAILTGLVKVASRVFRATNVSAEAALDELTIENRRSEI